MGISKRAYICYGVIPSNIVDLPWSAEPYGYEIDTWWLFEVLGFRHSFEIYDENYEFIGGIRPPQATIDAYFQEEYDFRKHNPGLPVEIVEYGFGSNPSFILAVPFSVRVAHKCTPQQFDPRLLKVTEYEQQALISFCKQYNITFYEGPRWWLSFYRD